MQHPERVILHLDMDAFYAAVEIREDPSLADRPLIVGHRGRRGVVSTCSYEARRFGVRSAMPSVVAARLCPDAVWRPGRMRLYVEVSRRIRMLMRDFSPVVEPLSIDEAFIDLTGIVPDLGAGAESARRLQARIRRQERLGASVGIAPNKFLAKLASDMEKPGGLVTLALADVEERLWPLPVERLWGVGPRTAERLRRAGIRTVGDIHRAGPARLEGLVGPGAAGHLHRLSRGSDERPVETARRAKSLSEERTYGEDLTSAEEIDRALLARAVGVARQLRQAGLVGRTVHLKVRTGDYTTWTRSETLREPTDLAAPLLESARRMFRERIRLGGRGVRLLGLGVGGLDAPGTGQASLFRDPAQTRARRLARAGDAIRGKLGSDVLTRARLIRSKRRGAGNGPEEATSPPTVD
jgi:DNA polymerase-4